MAGYLGSVGGKLKSGYRKYVEEPIIDAAPILDVNKWGGKVQASWERGTGVPKFGGEAAFGADPYKAEQEKSQAAQAAAGSSQMVGGQSFQQMLADQMTGKAPSVADAQMRAAFDRSIAAQQSATAGARGVNPALAQRLIAQQAGAQRAELGQQSGIARMQEQQQAQAGFAGELARQDAQTRFFEAQRSGNFQAMQQAAQEMEKLKYGARVSQQQSNLDFLGKAGQAGATAFAGA